MEKPNGFKLAYYRKIPIYYNTQTDELIGRNWFYDKLAYINILIDFYILNLEEIPILIEED